MIRICEKATKKIPGRSSLFVSFDYNERVVSAVKECQPCHYDKTTKVWEIPTTRLSKLINTLHPIDDIELTLKKDKKEEPKVFTLSKYKTKPYKYQEYYLLYKPY